MSNLPIQGPPLASPCIDVPPSLRDSSSCSAVSEIASSRLQTPTSLTPLSLSGRIATAPPPLPLGLSALGMAGHNTHTPHNFGVRQTPLPPKPPQDPTTAGGADDFDVGMNLWDEDTVRHLKLPTTQPAQDLPAAAGGADDFDVGIDLWDEDTVAHLKLPTTQPAKDLPAAAGGSDGFDVGMYLWDEDTVAHLKLPTTQPARDLPAATGGADDFDIGMDLGDEDTLPARDLPAAAAGPGRHARGLASQPRKAAARLEDHPAWAAVDKSKYTPEELVEIGNFTLGAKKLVSWKCIAPDCQREWKSDVRNRTKIKYPTLCLDCTRASKPKLSTHPAWKAVNTSKYTEQQLAEIGNLTEGSNTTLFWKCTALDCTHEWSGTINSRCDSKYPAFCPLCARSAKGELKSHPAWKTVATSEYTPEELVDIGNLDLESKRDILWKCTAPGCTKIWNAKIATRCRRRSPPTCIDCTNSPKPTLNAHPAWEAVDTSKYTEQQLDEIGNLTKGSITTLFWKCTALGCTHEWQGTIVARCSVKYPTICASCVKSAKGELKSHPAWRAVDRSKYTKEELIKIGNLGLGSNRVVLWRCAAPGCEKEWNSSVHTRLRTRCPSICTDCFKQKKVAERAQKRARFT